jgi:tRNA G18 (ribose-2'-O)-methylase SpoU
MTDLRITHANDPRVSDFVALNDPELRKGREASEGFFVAEGPHVIANVAAAGCTFRSVLVTPKQQVALQPVLDTLTCPIYVAAESVLRDVVGFHLHRGAVASVERWPLPDLGAVLGGATRVAAVEAGNDHENLGVIFRSAVALGIDAVVLDPLTADPLYRRSVRVSIGHVCRVPWTRYETIDDLVAAGLAVVALTPDGAIALPEYDWPARCALVVGAEGHGLSAATLARADARVRIPMEPGVDSLNIGTAAGIAFYAARHGQ